MKLAIIVILYNPSSDVVTNISSYKEYADQLILIDNSSYDNSSMFASDEKTYINKYVNP